MEYRVVKRINENPEKNCTAVIQYSVLGYTKPHRMPCFSTIIYLILKKFCCIH